MPSCVIDIALIFASVKQKIDALPPFILSWTIVNHFDLWNDQSYSVTLLHRFGSFWLKCSLYFNLYRNTLAKMVALQNGTLDTIHSLLDEAAEQNMTNADTLKLIQRGVGTLGALLRDFPVAQRYFFGNQTGLSHLSPPGLILLSRLFNLLQTPHQTELSVDSRVRILTLLSDIARERVSITTKTTFAI